MIVRFELKLTNNTPENWEVWKGLESKMTWYCHKHGVSEFNILYDDLTQVKKVTLQYESEKQFIELMTVAGICAGKHGLEVDVISRTVLEDDLSETIFQIKECLQA